MARGGVYKSEVEKARNSLIAQGINPSIDAVRVALGNTGSKSTIHRFLKELEAEEGAGTARKIAVSDALQDLVGRLAARLHEEADAMIADAKQRSDAVLATQKKAAEALQQENAGLSTQLQRTEVALQAKATELDAAMQRLQDQSVSIAKLEQRTQGLEQQLGEREEHIRSLEEKHQHAREALEHFRNSTKEQRDQDQRRHEHEVQGLQVALRQANETIGSKNEELLKLNRDNARMITQIGDLEKASHQTQRDQQRMAHEIEDLRGQLRDHQELEKRCEEAMRTGERLRLDLETAATEVTHERTRRERAEAEFAQLQGRVRALEEAIRMLRPAEVDGEAKPTEAKEQRGSRKNIS